MNNVWLIARREYLQRVRSRAFRIGTVIVPLAFAAFFGITLLSQRSAGTPDHFVVASTDPQLAEGVVTELKTPRDPGQKISSDIETRTLASDSNLDELNGEVESKRIDGYLWLKLKPGKALPEAAYVSRGSGDVVGAGSRGLRNAIGRAAVREELLKHNVTPETAAALLQDVDLRTLRVTGGQAQPSDAAKNIGGAYAMAMLLYVMVLFYGVNAAHSVAAEKTSRVFEVLLASVEPSALLAGKLLGVGAAAFTQMAIWAGAVFALGASSLVLTVDPEGLAAYGITPFRLLFFLIYFLLGFFLYGAFSVALGATVGQETEIQQLNMLIAMPQVFALASLVYVLSHPSAWQAVLLSLFPPFTPVIMSLRMGAISVPLWQLALSIILMAASICGVLWVAARIYRVGILMYGKRSTLPEIVRWLRYN